MDICQTDGFLGDQDDYSTIKLPFLTRQHNYDSYMPIIKLVLCFCLKKISLGDMNMIRWMIPLFMFPLHLVSGLD